MSSLNGVNLNFLSAVELATESTSQAHAAGRQALTSTASEAFKQTVSKLGLSSSQQSALLNTFNTAMSASGGSASQHSPQAQAVLDSAFRNGGLAQSTQQMTDAMTKLTEALGAQGQQSAQGSGGGGDGGSWLEAIAKAMGTALGNMASKMVDESNQLSTLSGDSSSTGAQQFQQEMTKFQADAQLFGMLSDAFSNAIKSIGQGMQTMGGRN
jgi:hypothetical protein